MSETFVTQEEFKRLEARVLMVEHEVEGEKLLSRYTPPNPARMAMIWRR
jgi:hypothetical protein